jgi:two-component system, NarL family, nitrate/nitrite response regulator NarL
VRRYADSIVAVADEDLPLTREVEPRVAIIMEIGLFRDALARAVRRAGLEVVESGAPVPDAETLKELEADVVLVDVSRRGGLEALQRIASAAPEIRLLAVAVPDREPDVLACIEAGAAGYVLRDASLEELADAARRAVRDEPLASPHVIATLMRRVAALSAHGRTGGLRELTSRELEVVQLIEKGLSNKEIATQLSIAVTTVKNHVHSILEKLGVQRRGEVASIMRVSAPVD